MRTEFESIAPGHNENMLANKQSGDNDGFKSSPRDKGNVDKVHALPEGITTIASGFEPGTSWLRVQGLIH